MRDVALWGFALLFLVTAVFTVGVRREVYVLGRTIGALEQELLRAHRVADNLELDRERLCSPRRLLEHALEEAR